MVAFPGVIIIWIMFNNITAHNKEKQNIHTVSRVKEPEVLKEFSPTFTYFIITKQLPQNHKNPT